MKLPNIYYSKFDYGLCHKFNVYPYIKHQFKRTRSEFVNFCSLYYQEGRDCWILREHNKRGFNRYYEYPKMLHKKRVYVDAKKVKKKLVIELIDKGYHVAVSNPPITWVSTLKCDVFLVNILSEVLITPTGYKIPVTGARRVLRVPYQQYYNYWIKKFGIKNKFDPVMNVKQAKLFNFQSYQLAREWNMKSRKDINIPKMQEPDLPKDVIPASPRGLTHEIDNSPNGDERIKYNCPYGDKCVEASSGQICSHIKGLDKIAQKFGSRDPEVITKGLIELNAESASRVTWGMQKEQEEGSLSSVVNQALNDVQKNSIEILKILNPALRKSTSIQILNANVGASDTVKNLNEAGMSNEVREQLARVISGIIEEKESGGTKGA